MPIDLADRVLGELLFFFLSEPVLRPVCVPGLEEVLTPGEPPVVAAPPPAEPPPAPPPPPVLVPPGLA